MARSPDQLRRALDAIAPQPYREIVHRHHSASYGALSGDGARLHGGRWNPPGSFATVYAASDVSTVDAELHRALHRARLAGDQLGRRQLSTLHVDLRRVLDLRSDDVRAALGITVEEITADDPSVSRTIGQLAHEAGFEAVVAPSAAADGDVIAIFPGSLAQESSVRVAGTRPYPSHAPD